MSAPQKSGGTSRALAGVPENTSVAVDAPPANNAMQPTANSVAFIEDLAVAALNARRLMAGVGWLLGSWRIT